MKEFKYSTTERGMNIYIMFCAKTKKDAANILGISMYELNNYCSYYQPQTKECIENPYLRFAMADSGEMWYARPDLKGKVVKYIDMKSIILEYRQRFRTYSETMAAFEKRRLPWQQG